MCKVNIQPMLDEMKKAAGDTSMKCPVLVKLYKDHGFEVANNAIRKHWQEVDQGITAEYVQS